MLVSGRVSIRHQSTRKKAQNDARTLHFLECLGISDDYFNIPGVPMFVALYTLLNHVFQEKTPYGYTL